MLPRCRQGRALRGVGAPGCSQLGSPAQIKIFIFYHVGRFRSKYRAISLFRSQAGWIQRLIANRQRPWAVWHATLSRVAAEIPKVSEEQPSRLAFKRILDRRSCLPTLPPIQNVYNDGGAHAEQNESSLAREFVHHVANESLKRLVLHELLVDLCVVLQEVLPYLGPRMK
jgi:hypothetical protein